MTWFPDETAQDAVPLETLPDGTGARLVMIQGGAGLRSRLTAMGLRAGAAVRVVHNGGRGPFVVAAGESRIVLGRGMARKVLVVPENGPPRGGETPG
ncbi:MAG: FeoA family protein [Phycisphaerae bacterium]